MSQSAYGLPWNAYPTQQPFTAHAPLATLNGAGLGYGAATYGPEDHYRFDASPFDQSPQTWADGGSSGFWGSALSGRAGGQLGMVDYDPTYGLDSSGADPVTFGDGGSSGFDGSGLGEPPGPDGSYVYGPMNTPGQDMTPPPSPAGLSVLPTWALWAAGGVVALGVLGVLK